MVEKYLVSGKGLILVLVVSGSDEPLHKRKPPTPCIGIVARVLIVCSLLLAVTGSVGATSSSVTAKVSGASLLTTSSTSNLRLKRYVAAGDRAYVIGAENGSFPPMGWHITGLMGGVWAHPIKLLDGYWLRLGTHWLTNADKFTSGPGYVEMSFPSVDGIGVTRTEFSPDGIPAVLVRVSLANAGSSKKTIPLTAVVRSELMAAYPWASTQPNAGDFNGHDRGSYTASNGRLTFKEPGKPWYAMVQASVKPKSGATSDDFWGPVSPADQGSFAQYGYGTGGKLEWQIALPPRSSTDVWLAIAGSHTSEGEASSALHVALSGPNKLLAEKIADRQTLLNQTEIAVPDKPLEAAFQWAKMNMADLRRTVTDVQVRPTSDGTEYPPPVKTFKQLSGIGAGFPDYPWFFGADGAYTTYALVASGQWQTAMDHLQTIREVSQAVNGNTGKVVHEVVTDGSVYFGLNSDSGDTNETAQFAVAVDLLWRWTGDHAFLQKMYPFVKAGLHYITSRQLDPDGDGWPEGAGMVEVSGMASAKLDVASYVWLALQSLGEMAAAEGDHSTQVWAASKAAWMQSHFASAWWVAKDSLYADSLCSAADVTSGTGPCTRAGQKLQEKYWIDATPMETGLAPSSDANKALNYMQSGTFTGAGGLYQAGKNGGADGHGDLRIWTLPTSVMAVAEGNYGRVDDSLTYVDDIARLLDLEMPGALPEMAPSPAYDPFQNMTSRAMFMQAWSAYGIQWPVIHDFLGIDPNVPDKAITVIPDPPSTWSGLSVSDLRVGSGSMSVSEQRTGLSYTIQVTVPKGFSLTIGQVIPSGLHVESVILDGTSAVYSVVDTSRGEEVHVTASTNVSHSLVVALTK
jgi:glycogen debranching enzyme